MKLPWQRDKEPAKGLRKIRAAVMPLAFNSKVVFGATENNFTVNSISTHIVDLQPLKPGQTAEDVAPFTPGAFSGGGPLMTQEEAKVRNMQRLQFNAPNWVGVLVSSDSTAYRLHMDIPVWADENNTLHSVDVEAMMAELEPRRQRASEIWGKEDGVFSDLHAILGAPQQIAKAAKSLFALPGDILKSIKEIGQKEDPTIPDPTPKPYRPDLSQYPPVDGMDYQTIVTLQAKPELIPQSDFADDARRLAAGKVWNERIHSDWKLSTLFSCDVDRIRKGATPSWEWND